ncbi:hypothetical protein MOQ72_34110 [Saccharopolyspora sp. K220]|uniref:hypothetical protein n=1 Tax=Saccharopolyspora soli TaxID=2926618 RepID=UPI001F565325|nr:hypothetical protein [Saccharopolyspora soli]MCI2422474.1 hypothetical protein [Saccharopolyspora soli]
MTTTPFADSAVLHAMQLDGFDPDRGTYYRGEVRGPLGALIELGVDGTTGTVTFYRYADGAYLGAEGRTDIRLDSGSFERWITTCFQTMRAKLDLADAAAAYTS